MINEQGGVNGRKINLISLMTPIARPFVDMVRRLVEEERVRRSCSILGTPPNTAIRQYLNDNKIPQLFVVTGAAKWNDPKHFLPGPWPAELPPAEGSESTPSTHTPSDGATGVLYQNDDYGKDYLIGLRDGLGRTTPAW